MKAREEVTGYGGLELVSPYEIQNSHDLKVTQTINYIELEAISQTFLLDTQRKSRSFRDASMRYRELADLVLGGYPGSDSIDNVTESIPLGNFVLQYKETEWGFLKQLALYFEPILVAEAGAASMIPMAGGADG